LACAETPARTWSLAGACIESVMQIPEKGIQFIYRVAK
jgi:hypothetical protein